MANVIDDLLGPREGRKEKDGLAKSLEALDGRLSAQSKRLDELSKAYGVIRKRVLEFSETGEDQKARQEVRELQKRLERISDEIVSRGRQQSDIESAIARLSKEVKMVSAQTKKRESQLSAIAEKLDDTELERKMDQLNERIRLFSDVRETLISSINAIERRLNKLEKSTLAFESEKMELSQKAGSLGEKFGKNMELTSRLHDKCEQLETKVENLSELSNTVSKELMEIRRGATEREELKSELELSKTVEEGLVERIREVEETGKARAEKLEAKLEAVEEAAKAAGGGMARIEKVESAQQGLAEKLEETERNLRRGVEDLKDEIKTVGGKETVASSERVMNALKELSKREEHLQGEIEKMKGMGASLDRAREDFDRLEEVVDQNQRILAGMEADDRFSRLEKKTSEMGEVIDELQIRMERSKEREREMVEKALQEPLHEMKKRLESVPGDELKKEVGVLRETRDILNDRINTIAKSVKGIGEAQASLIERVEKLGEKAVTKEEMKAMDSGEEARKVAASIRGEIRSLLDRVEKVNAKVNTSSADLARMEKGVESHEKHVEKLLDKIERLEEASPHETREKLSEMEADLRRISNVARTMEEELKEMPTKTDIRDLILLVEKMVPKLEE